MSEHSRVVVVGGAAAGMSTADALTRFGFTGALTVLDAEPGAPYDRPPLSKQVLDGTWEPERARLFPPDRLERIGGSRLDGVAATSLDRQRSVVTTSTGAKIGYDHVVIATGVHPRRISGDDLPGVHVLRSLPDALALRRALLGAQEFVIVGAGFIGLEVAASARRLGVAVTVVDPDPFPLASRLGSHVAGRILDLHRARGVEIRCGTGVTDFVMDPTGTALSALGLTDGTVIATNHALVAIGCRPRTAWLESAGLVLDDGVVCDHTGNAAPGVWAVGDVARWQSGVSGEPTRTEHRQNATDQATVVARRILGQPVPNTPTPYFWTDQHDVRIQVCGHVPPGAKSVVVEGDPAGDSFILRVEHDGAPVGLLGWNAARAFTQHRRLLNSD